MPDCGIQGRYDCGFLDASGNFVGLVLVRDKNGIPKYAETNDPGLSRQYFTGQASYTNFEPLKKIQIGQSDYRAGFGQEYYDSAEPKKYYYGIDIDARFKDMLIAGPKATAITMPSTSLVLASAALTNGDMETAASGWTNGARSNTVYKNGAYSWYLGLNVEVEAYQDLTWSTSFQNKTAYFWCWVKQATNDSSFCKIGINDGVGTTYSSWHGANTNWELLTVSRTLDASATRYRVLLYQAAAAGASAYCDDARVVVASAPTAMCEFNSNLYFGIGNTLYKLNGTGDGLTFVGVFMASITSLEAFTDDQLYIALGASNKYYYMSTAEAFTETDSTAYYFKTIGTTMYKVLLPRSVYTATAPTTDAGWSAATTVGTSATNITDIDEIKGVPYIGKADKPYYINTSGVPIVLVEDLRSEQASSSGKNMHTWQGNLYYPCGNQGLYEYNTGSASLTDISPSKFITNSGDFDGQVMGLASDAQWLFAFIDNSTKLELLAGRWETVDGSTAWSWHSLAELTLTGAELAFASTVYARRLWVCSTAAADSIYYYPLPAQYGNITADTSYAFQTGGYLITPYLHAEFKSDKKAFYELTLTMSGTSANVYWRAHYEKLGDSSWAEINSTDKFKTSPTTTALIPVDGSSNKPQSTMMRFKFEQVTNATTSTPVLLNYNVRAIWYPRNEKVILCQVYASDNLLLKDGTNIDEEQSAGEIRTALEAWNNPTVAWPRAFYPIYWDGSGDTVYAKLQPTEGVPFYTIISDERTGSLEGVYNLNLLVVSGLTF